MNIATKQEVSERKIQTVLANLKLSQLHPSEEALNEMQQHLDGHLTIDEVISKNHQTTQRNLT